MVKRFWPQATLALSVAAIPALAAATPIIAKSLTPKRSHFEFAFQAATYDKVIAFVSNTGNRPGTVNAVIFRIERQNGADEHWLYTADDDGGLGRPVQPGARILETFVNTADRFDGAGSRDHCSVALHVVNFDSTAQTITQSVDCTRLELLTG